MLTFAAAVASEFWGVMAELLLLLAAAFVLGTLFERMRQSAILGYLLAGTIAAPWIGVEGHEAVHGLAELGVAMLLFAIGLEFSIKRLLRIGPVGLGGGTAQVVATVVLAAGVAMLAGQGGRAAIAVGAIVALSSTATVMRVLADRAMMDSLFGRASVGILLLQDIAVVPLVLIVTMLAGEGSAWGVFTGLGWTMLLILALVSALYLGSKLITYRVMRERALVRNRELLVLLATVMATGSAIGAAWMGLSPALGAFVAGMMLSETPFAIQIRADMAALRTLLVTLFFVSIGMLGDPVWIAQNAGSVAAAVGLIVLGKTLVITIVAMAFRLRFRHALAAGLCLAQVGEFSFVIAQVAHTQGTIDDWLFRLMVSATLVTLFITPYLVYGAPKIGGWLEDRLRRRGPSVETEQAAGDQGFHDHVIVVGFGPSGQEVVQTLQRRRVTTLVIDLHGRNVEQARRMGVTALIGDASSGEMWEHLHLPAAKAVIVTLPDHGTAMQAVRQVNTIAPGVPVIVRARYRTFVDDLTAAGAHAVVDEESLTGRQLGVVVARLIGDHSDEKPAGP